MWVVADLDEDYIAKMRGASGGIVTVPARQQRQARFSRLITRTKYRAGSTSSCSLALVVPDHGGRGSALPARLLCAQDYLLDSREVLRQALPARMLPQWARGSFGERCALRFRLHFVQRCACSWSASNSSCRSLNVSLRGPRSFTLCCRNSSSNDWIFRCAHANSRSRSAMRF